MKGTISLWQNFNYIILFIISGIWCENLDQDRSHDRAEFTMQTN